MAARPVAGFWSPRALLVAAALAAVGGSVGLVRALAKGVADQPADPQTVKDDPRWLARWVYDDVDKGFVKAKESGKPLMIVFR